MKARIAVLVDHFKLTPEQIGRLTDKQITEIYFHERDEQGKIKEPPPLRERTMTNDLIDIDMLAANNLISGEKAQELKEKVKDKWQRQPQRVEQTL